MVDQEIKLTEDQINLIIDNDPSGNQMYMDWMIKEASKGTDINTIIDVTKKMWERKAPISPDKSIGELLSSYDIPEIKKYTEGSKLIYYKKNILVLQIMDDNALALNLNTEWKKNYDTFHKDNKERTRPVFVFLNLKEINKKSPVFKISWINKEEEIEQKSFMMVVCLGDPLNKIFPLNDIQIPKELKEHLSDKSPEEKKALTLNYIYSKINELQDIWFDSKEITDAYIKETIPFRKYFFNKELLNFYQREFWNLFPFIDGENPSKETDPWTSKYLSKRVENIKKMMHPSQGYTDIQRATMEKIVMEMEAIILHINNLKEEIYKRPKLPN